MNQKAVVILALCVVAVTARSWIPTQNSRYLPHRDHTAAPSTPGADRAEPQTDTECIAYLKVEAMTGDVYGGSQSSFYGDDPILTLLLHSGLEYHAELRGSKRQNAPYTTELEFRSAFGTENCVNRDDIKEVYLEAGVRGDDGWYVASIDTYTAGINKFYALQTTDPGFSMWVDADEEYPYNAKKHLLTNAVVGSCITYVRVNAMTGNKYGAGFSPKYGDNHLIVFVLSNDEELQAELEGPADQNEPYIRELHFASRFQTTQCVASADIKEIHLKTQTEGTDGWYIASIDTYTKSGVEQYERLTSDPDLNKWLDADEQYPYDATDILLTWVNEDIPDCGYGKPTCECNANANVCIFNLEIDEIRTFTSYQKFPVDEAIGISVRGVQGVIYYFDDNGIAQPLQTSRKCATLNSAQCTDPQFVDGKTYRLAIAVNGQVPGPTLIVHENQTVVVHVHNNLTIEGVSIHWHGMHQIGTPWMDGVGQVTQCQIGPSSSFSYMYKASPSGTFWYHSHSGAQRTDGFFGSLIVKERPTKLAYVKIELQFYGIDDFEDLPDKHTLTLLDWQHEASLDLFTQINAGLGFYPNKELGEVPTPDDQRCIYESTHSFEEGDVGPVPFYSGIINGKGRHEDVPYEKTRLSIFTVEEGKTYRFRLVGAQGLYAYKFSIDGHKLTVVATDGYWIEPVKEVDYIIIHTGERYDFLLNAAGKTRQANYWIRAETLEIDRYGNGPPYQSLGHVAEAILHYKQQGESDSPTIPSTAYRNIKQLSPPIQCTSANPCKAVNCPFKEFHPSYNIECVNVQSLRLLESTPDDELPDANPNPSCSECEYFINFNFEGDSQSSSVNGRNFILPSFPPQTQNAEFQANDVKCDLQADCNPSTLECSCVHVIDIPYKKTIQLVLTGIGKYHNAHPIHLHGHSFHVVHVGYPEYDPETGFITTHSRDITCADEHCTKEECDTNRCTRPSWNTKPPLSIDRKTVRKDTVMLPAGGYVVINFLSNNPGHWFLHCHIEVHQLEGMAMIVNEAIDHQQPAPEGMNKCGDFAISIDDFHSYSAETQGFEHPQQFKISRLRPSSDFTHF